MVAGDANNGAVDIPKGGPPIEVSGVMDMFVVGGVAIREML